MSNYQGGDMKLIWMFVCMSFINLTAFGKTLISTIHSIDLGEKLEPHFVRFDNGRVSFLDPQKSSLLDSLIKSEEKKEIIEVKLDRENYIYAAMTVGHEPEDQEMISPNSWSAEPYKPSVVRSTNSALMIFNKMRKDYTKEGECYNRAHIWAYEEFRRSGLNSMKLFMFFTERYIRNYRFHWWFHVTPMTYILSSNSPRTLDRRYTSGPRQTKTWSDVFIKSKRTCKKVKTFNEYFENQRTQDCYHIDASMYYVRPRDLEKRDITGIEKSEFIEKEVIRAYRNGFNI